MKTNLNIKTNSTSEYFRLLINNLFPDHKVREQDLTLFCHLCSLADVDGNVLVSIEERKRMSEAFKMSTQALTNSLSRLKSFNLITGSKGKYFVRLGVFLSGMEKDAFLKKEFTITTTIQLDDSYRNKT